MSNIIRILESSFGVSMPNDSLNDFDLFMERFGKSISMEIIAMMFGAINRSIQSNDKNLNEYKISIRLEKCERFPVCRGEYIA